MKRNRLLDKEMLSISQELDHLIHLYYIQQKKKNAQEKEKEDNTE